MSSLQSISVIVFGTLWIASCAGRTGPGSDTASRVDRGIEATARGEYDQALDDFGTAFELTHEPDVLAHIAHAKFLRGEYREALDLYLGYLETRDDIPAWERDALEREVARIALSLERGLDLSGESEAARHFRGHRALIEADRALVRGDFAEAHRHFRAAFELHANPRLLLESALAASKAGLWSEAEQALSGYLEVAGDELTSREQARIAEELRRLRQGRWGLHKEVAPGLADCVYSRRGPRGVSRTELAAAVDTSIGICTEGERRAAAEPWKPFVGDGL